jgi:hypothetical protein
MAAPRRTYRFGAITVVGRAAGVATRPSANGLPADALEEQFRAHVNRGVIALYGLVKGVSDLTAICLHRANPTSGH